MIIVFADLLSPLMFDRINILSKIDNNIILVHNADNKKLDNSIYEKFKNFTIIEQPHIKYRTLRYLISAFFTMYLIIKYNPSLIVVHWASRLYQSIPLYFFSSRVIVSTMGSDINKEVEAKGYKYIFINLLLKSCKAITVKSNFMKNTIIKNFPRVNKDKISLINWGVDDRFKTNNKDAELLKELNIRESKKVYFCIRSMSDFYHKKDILKTFLEYKKQTGCDDILLVSSMGSYNSNNKYLDEYKSIVQKSKYKDDIYLVNIQHQNMHRYISISDAVISYVFTDGLSQSLMEAVYANKFCITYDNQNHKDIIKHKYNGYFFSTTDELLRAMQYNFDKDYKIDCSLLNRNSQIDKYINLCKKIINKKG